MGGAYVLSSELSTRDPEMNEKQCLAHQENKKEEIMTQGRECPLSLGLSLCGSKTLMTRWLAYANMGWG